MPDIFTELRQDHSEILRMLYELGERRADPLRLFPEVYHRLSAHLGAEQDTLYEDLLHDAVTRERALEGFVEHRLIAQLLAELAPADPFQESWHATLAVLRIMFGRHVADEEGPLFELAARTIDRQRSAELGGRFSAERERHLKLATVIR